jgi:hypothetical protein
MLLPDVFAESHNAAVFFLQKQRECITFGSIG